MDPDSAGSRLSLSVIAKAGYGMMTIRDWAVYISSIGGAHILIISLFSVFVFRFSSRAMV